MLLPQLSLTTSLVPAVEVSFRSTAGGALLLNLSTGECFRLDEIGSRLWSQLSAGKTVGAAASAMHAAYDVSRETLETDVLQLCRELVAAGLLQEPSRDGA